ncbi:MAG: Bacterial antitoxin of ParD toxin-antitoxin type system [Pseudomonadota bacterium]|jgi:putative addiction module CopG family antidote
MAGRTTSYILTEQDDAFIRAQLKAGEQSTASEVMREAMRRYREERAAERRLHKLLDEGAKSPLVEGGPKEVFERVISRYRAATRG